MKHETQKIPNDPDAQYRIFLAIVKSVTECNDFDKNMQRLQDDLPLAGYGIQSGIQMASNSCQNSQDSQEKGRLACLRKAGYYIKKAVFGDSPM